MRLRTVRRRLGLWTRSTRGGAICSKDNSAAGAADMAELVGYAAVLWSRLEEALLAGAGVALAGFYALESAKECGTDRARAALVNGFGGLRLIDLVIEADTAVVFEQPPPPP